MTSARVPGVINTTSLRTLVSVLVFGRCRFRTTRRALNCASNSKILEQMPFREVFVQPGVFETMVGKNSMEVLTDTLMVR